MLRNTSFDIVLKSLHTEKCPQNSFEKLRQIQNYGNHLDY